MGAVSAPRIVIDSVRDLYDYDHLRQLGDAMMFVPQTTSPLAVLGGNQSLDVLKTPRDATLNVRRRRGGGGLVVLRPGDLWVDWWIPRHDERWSYDVRESSEHVGTWWAEQLRRIGAREVVIHRGALEVDERFTVVCFSGRGPGEVFVGGRKAVGVSQWRVREGVFLSSVLHARSSVDVVDWLANEPSGLRATLDHSSLSSLPPFDVAALLDGLRHTSGPWQYRPIDVI